MNAPNARKFTYDYPRPAVTVDVVLITRDERPHVLLIQRLNEPFAQSWALPGGFVNADEPLADAARRELVEETNVTISDFEQLYTTGDPGRDPRGWTISVAFLARTNGKRPKAKAGDDAAAATWFPLDALPPLAFDHAMLIERAKTRLTDRSA